MRLATVVLLLALPAVAKPSLSDALKKFPTLSLPLTLQASPALERKLSRKDVVALGLEGQPLLADLEAKPRKAEQRTLWALGRIERATHTLLLLRLDHELPKLSARETLLFSLDASQVLVGAAALHVESKEDLRAVTGITTLDAAGGIARAVKEVRKQAEAGLPEELTVTFEQRVRVTSSGALEVSPTQWTARTGAYLDERSGEELRVAVKRVFYRPRAGEAFVELVGDGNTVRLGDDPRPWLLTWNDRRSEITAQTPSGDVQRFVRQW